MTNKQSCVLGMVGLGVMGRNLLLNMADHGFTVAGFDKDKTKVDSLSSEAKNHSIFGADNVKDFLQLLQTPRTIMLLVPAGKAVDAVIDELIPHLQKGDLIIDAGNSHFTDTNRRIDSLQKMDIQFLGIGISGGEEGARHGPSIMPGGVKESYEHIRPILEAIAAKADGEPCVTYLGKGSVGHYVKMVHNGIEYGIMQLIAETYDVMKRGLNLSNQQIEATYQAWNDTELNSYLVEISSRIFSKMDTKTGKPLIDEIVSVAKQNGTGMWTSQSSMELQVPTPTIDIAVTMRDLSVQVQQREQASNLYQRSMIPLKKDIDTSLNQLRSALYTGMMLVYAQGMSLLNVASDQYGYELELESVARIWRGGCIIRAKLLTNIVAAYQKNSHLVNLLLDPDMAHRVMEHQEGLRQINCKISMIGVAAPALMSTQAYLDAYRSAWQPANLIQAQRDYFGSHTYQRIDAEGTFHTLWEEDLSS
jgi:6-phosphogluconate dehydrogenase